MIVDKRLAPDGGQATSLKTIMLRIVVERG